MRNWIDPPVFRAAWAAAGLLALSACGSTPTSEIFRDDVPSMGEIYGASTARVRGPRHVAGKSDGDVTGYTREAGNEIRNLFPTLENPTLLMYVFPHVTGKGVAVPGYATAFPMYEQGVIYALPGEPAARGGR